MTLLQKFRRLCSRICRIEGKKHEASYGDVQEIVSIIATMQAEHMLKGRKSMSPIAVIESLAMKKALVMVRKKIGK